MTLSNMIGFLDRYNLPWLLLALITWTVILMSCSKRFIIAKLPVGIWTATVGYLGEKFFINHKFWSEHFIMIQIDGLDLFVVIGPFFSLGILLIRFLPKTRLHKFLMPLFWASLATGIELIALRLGFLAYHETKWGFLHSIVTYYIFLMSALGFYYTMVNIQPD